MSASEPKAAEKKNLPGIFISYRRSDNPDATGRIYDRLVSEFGKSRVFKDVDSIPLGQDFRGHLNDVVGGCAAVLAIIGPKWTDIRNEAGQKRLEDPDDFVRIELEAALARSVPVVPVLVGHAPMPGTFQLPATLASLAFRQSIEVRPDPDFHNDATRLVVALQKILDPNAPRGEATATATAAGSQTSAATMQRMHQRRLAWMTGIAAVLALTVIALVIPAMRRLREVPPPELRADIITPASDDPDSFALSPDGRQIVLVANTGGIARLLLRSLSSTTAQPLSGTEGASQPFWSPDSRSIGFFASGALKRIDLGAGAPRVLVPNAGLFLSGTWSSGGVIVFGAGLHVPLQRVSATGGTPVPTTKFDPNLISQHSPYFLPDGHHFLFSADGKSEKSGIFLGALDGSVPVRLTAEESHGVFLRSGWLLWIRQGSLVAQRLDLAKAALTGEPLTIADGVATVSVSSTGLIAYRSAGAIVQRRLVWMDRTGTVQGSVGDPDSTFDFPRLSPDGRRIVISRTVQGNQDVFLLDGTRMTRLTFNPASESFPLWSPDGERVIYMSRRLGTFDFFQKLASGAGGEEQLNVTDNRPKVPTSISSDGRFLLYFTAEGSTDIWILPLSGDRKPFVFLQTAFNENWSTFSPDGKWVAYQSDETGGYEVYVRPFIRPGTLEKGSVPDTSAGQWQVSTEGGVHPAWRPDGKEIYFIDPSGAMMAAPVSVKGPTLESGTPVKLFTSRIVGGGEDQGGRKYDVAPDGRFLVNTQVEGAVTQPITLLQNWGRDASK
jgi:eukaryotic-like serine/threonine-protein kinase